MEDNGNSFGTLFRDAREQAGRQLGDIAAELHINAAHLQALENEKFDRLPSHSFARGYIRAYARALETDPEPLLKAYLRAAPPTEEWHAKKPLEEEIQPSRMPLLIGTAVVAATVVALFVVWFLGSGYLDKEPTVIDTAAVVQTPTEPAPVIEPAVSVVTPTEQDGSEPEASPESGAANVAEADEQPAAQGESQAETEIAAQQAKRESKQEDAQKTEKPTDSTADAKTARVAPDPANPDLIRAPEGNDKVEITLNDKSWIDIRDANGHRLLRGLYLKGASKTLIGQAPFQVFLGNAPAVELKAGGKPFDLSGFIRANNTARFAVLNDKTNN